MISNIEIPDFSFGSTFTDSGGEGDPFSDPDKRETKPDGPGEKKPDDPDEEKEEEQSERGGPIPNPADQTRARHRHGL